MKNSKRKLIVALNEAFEGGESAGRYFQAASALGAEVGVPENTYKELRVRPDHTLLRRQYIERLADWWDIYLSDDEDLL